MEVVCNGGSLHNADGISFPALSRHSALTLSFLSRFIIKLSGSVATIQQSL